MLSGESNNRSFVTGRSRGVAFGEPVGWWRVQIYNWECKVRQQALPCPGLHTRTWLAQGEARRGGLCSRVQRVTRYLLLDARGADERRSTVSVGLSSRPPHCC